MASNVYQIVSDPAFQKLSAADQQAVLGHFDPGFAKLPQNDFNQVVTHFQKQAMSRPDLVAPPGMPKGMTQDQAIQKIVAQDLGGGNHYEAASGKPDMFGQPTFDETTPEGSAAATAAREAQHPIISTAGHVAIGAGKEVGQIGYNAVDLANTGVRAVTRGTGALMSPFAPDAANAVSNSVAPMPPMPESLETHGTAEKVGQIGTGAAAMFLAPELLAEAAPELAPYLAGTKTIGQLGRWGTLGARTLAQGTLGATTNMLTSGVNKENAAIGGAFSGAMPGLGLAGESFAKTATGKYINQALGATKSYFKQGINPGKILQSIGITGEEPLEQIADTVGQAKQQAGKDIQSFWQQPKYAGTQLDATGHFQSLTNAIQDAHFNNDLATANDLQRAAGELESAQVPGRMPDMMAGPQPPTWQQNPNVPPSTMNYMRTRLFNMARDGGYTSEAQNVFRNIAKNMDGQLTNLAPEVKALNVRYGDLKDIETLTKSAANLAEAGGTMPGARTGLGATGGMLYGGYEGYQHGGVPGAIVGAGIGAATGGGVSHFLPQAGMFAARNADVLANPFVSRGLATAGTMATTGGVDYLRSLDTSQLTNPFMQPDQR